MEPCPRKELVSAGAINFVCCHLSATFNDPVSIALFQFENQQAQLEADIENLSWKIEHAETTDRGDLENQVRHTVA